MGSPDLPATFAWLDRLLRTHADDEDRWLLPIYEERVPHHPANATPKVLRDEHHKLRSLLIEAAGALDGPHIVLADILQRLAGVLEHHDAREHSSFKGQLDEVMTQAEKDDIIGRMFDRVAALGEPPPRPSVSRRPSEEPSATSAADALREHRESLLSAAPCEHTWAHFTALLAPEGVHAKKLSRQVEATDALLPADNAPLRDRLAHDDRLRLVGILLTGMNG